MLQRAREIAFFIGVFFLIVYGLSFLAPTPASSTPSVTLKDLLAPYVPGAIAILEAIGICILAIAVSLVIIPFRNWLAWQQKKHISKRVSKVAQEVEVAKAPVPVNDYRQRHQIAMPATEAPEQVARTQVLSHALHERLALRSGVIALLNNLGNWIGSEEREKASAENLVAELKQAIGALEQKSRQPVAKASQSALNGPSWRDMAQLVEWCRKEPAIGLKASRNAFRAAGIRISDADLQPGGAFNEWVSNLEVLPSPTAHGVPSVDAKQAESVGGRQTDQPRTADRRAAQRSQPRKRRG